MSVHSEIVDVSGTAAFPATAQIEILFEPRRIVVTNEDASDDAFVSLDGTTNDEVHLTASASISFEFQRVRKVWLRRGVVGTPATNVQVVAEG